MMKFAAKSPLRYALALVLLVGCSQTATPPKKEAKAAPAEQTAVCMVASVQPLATEAGVAAFEAGGNAIDAAVAAAVTLGVVDNHNSGLGGGCFILIRRADGTLVAIDGREEAPAAATHDMFIRDGEADPELSQTGPLAVGIPGALAAYDLAVSKYGKLPLKDLLLPAAKIAEEGFPIDRVYAGKLAASAKMLDKFAGSRTALLQADGGAYKEGDILKQPDLAKSYRAMAEEGTDWFYGGPFADKVASWMADNGGIITEADFASYLPVEREPLQTTYRDWTIVGFPPPSSGGVHVAQMLNMLETFDLKKTYEENPAQALHLIAETMKLAFADRAFWLGDPDAVDVPRGLIDKGYAVALAERINPERTTKVRSHGDPPAAAEDVFGKKHTTHITAADSDGNWVAITATVNTTFGSKVIVPGTGIVLNNEMDDFSAQPGKPNAFGLVGAENNAVAPGKRPLSSMTPTIVLKDGKPVMTVGAAGGPKIITSVLLAILQRLDFDQSLADSVGSPRIHQQWMPDVLTVEKKMPPEIIEQLKAKGHKVDAIDSGAVAQAIEIDAKGHFIGVHDPRIPGKAASGERPRK